MHRDTLDELDVGYLASEIASVDLKYVGKSMEISVSSFR